MPSPSAPRSPGAQRRGEELRRHILLVAKDVFLELGYERASMDAVAARAATSKRSLYAHFENKDRLFRAVLDLVRELYLGKLKTPEAYDDDPHEAVTLFCGRFVQLMVWEAQLRTCRLTIAEADRLPDSASAYFDAIFASTHERLTTYLTDRYALDADASRLLAQELIATTALPRLVGALLGVGEVILGHDPPDERDLPRHVDLNAIRIQVARSLTDHRAA